MGKADDDGGLNARLGGQRGTTAKRPLEGWKILPFLGINYVLFVVGLFNCASRAIVIMRRMRFN